MVPGRKRDLQDFSSLPLLEMTNSKISQFFKFFVNIWKWKLPVKNKAIGKLFTLNKKFEDLPEAMNRAPTMTCFITPPNPSYLKRGISINRDESL